MTIKHGFKRIIAMCHATSLLPLLIRFLWYTNTKKRAAGKNMRTSDDKTVHLINNFLHNKTNVTPISNPNFTTSNKIEGSDHLPKIRFVTTRA